MLRHTRHTLLAAAACLALFTGIRPSAAPQNAAAASSGTLAVSGAVRTPLSLAAVELKSMPRLQVEAKDHDGKPVKDHGVLVGEILKRAGATLGADLRGDAMASYVVAVAADGYRVVFSLAELDPALTGGEIIVADTADGKALAPSQGPLRIVVPKDTRPARSVRMLTRLDVVRLVK